MKYKRALKMSEELKSVNSNFVSISMSDYNGLLKVTEEDLVCINSSKEVELDVDDLKSLVERCIRHYE